MNKKSILILLLLANSFAVISGQNTPTIHMVGSVYRTDSYSSVSAWKNGIGTEYSKEKDNATVNGMFIAQ